MTQLPTDNGLWGGEPDSPLVAAVHLSVRDLVRRRFTESGLDWDAFVAGPIDDVITKDDLAAIDAAILASGHRYSFSATISAVERPDAYQGLGALEGGFDHPDAPSEPADADGKALCGVGDNVVQGAADVTGVARYVRSAAQVIALMEEGVPEGSIAIIDDSGGTLTAPILESFAGLVCAGGTVRSHLGILAREYGIPCLMNVRLSGVAEGDRVLLETTAAARTADSYLTDTEMPARIWKLS
ncbi:PEP-utilizing enzyme [Alterisphingorhabdus coralli]|uniref:PEP-utilizing enzyme n=1 Tax=Alterisphingorhabdus coralli TaxID=3071408 RepID=A0AA97F810_9SPHN|nr:PEP-utilizing enzyme [Parasphingorhabdus sp. SCSIO 66989]WOE75631.1 PEP-utilizing enzyme [Parasphingorhabdus sp. SCSIO 66989]